MWANPHKSDKLKKRFFLFIEIWVKKWFHV